jgi:hypothetical protein
VRREVTWAEVVLLPVALAAASGGLACSLLLLFEGRGGLSLLFALGGLMLALWAATRAIVSPRR